MEEYIEDLRQKKLSTFKDNYAQMVSEYNSEKKITNDYNGRQLLELIQNADDAKSDIVYIKLDVEKRILSISNNGDPFIKEGYRSLMISDLSSKIKKVFIGNKGLGFRSIISWSDSVKIICNNISVGFSEEIRMQTYFDLFDEDARQKINSEFGFKQEIVPLPFLAIPEITKSENNNFITTINIQYKNKSKIYEDIIKQVKELNIEVLLFLNSIKRIQFEGFDEIEKDIFITGNKNKEEPLNISDKELIVYEKNGKLDEKYQDPDSKENEYYQIKIAIPQNFTNTTNVLYTFFPTKVNLEFPFVVHGTFDLDSSRNQLTKSDKNKFVIEKLIELIIETAKKLSSRETSWEPIKMLRYRNENKVLSELEFYSIINKRIKTLELFPCIDNKYRNFENTIIYKNEFSQFIKESNFTRLFNNLLVPIEEDLYNWLLEIGITFYIYDKNDVVNKIDELSKNLKTINERVDLIDLLVDDKDFYSEGQQYSILLNEKKEIIDKNIAVFTPPTTRSEAFDIPDFVKIDFLNKDFYRKLLIKFNISESREKARDLQRQIKNITKINSFEPINVIERIIAESNRRINNEKDKSKINGIVQNMLRSLYKNFRDLRESTKLDASSPKIQIISRSGKLYHANELYLSSDYPSGILTEDIFREVFPKNYFIATRRILGLDKEDVTLVEKFLVEFIGVNKHTKYILDYKPENAYEKYVFSAIKKPRDFRNSRIEVTKIDNFNYISKKISYENLILWLMKDAFIYKQLNDKFNVDTFKYDKSREWADQFYHTLDEKPSYIKYQITSNFPFDEFFINNDRLSFINIHKLDYTNPIFNKYNITADEINNTLLQLGAKENFEDFSIDYIRDIIINLKEKDPTGKNAQKIYKSAFEHYKKHKQSLNLNEETLLFATKGEELDYFPANDVYYTDNITLPRKILDQCPILHFPKRAGELQVSEFFGIKTFKDYQVKVKDKVINDSLTDEVNTFLFEIKPFLLAIRLDKIAADKQKQINREANAIKNLKINLCSEIRCTIKGDDFELDEYDFIQSNDAFFIKICTISNLAELKSSSMVSDIISEIITITFKVNENKNDFRTCFRNNIEDTEYHTISEYGTEILQDAKELLNMSDYQKNFWDIIFTLKRQEFNLKIELPDQIENIFGFDYKDFINKIDYQYLSLDNNIKFLKIIFSDFLISIDDFNKQASRRIDLIEYHSRNFKNFFFSKEKEFKSLLWLVVSKDQDNQDNFLDSLSRFENNDLYIENIADKNRINFEIDYLFYFKNFIVEKFLFKYPEKVEIVDIDEIFKLNLIVFSPQEQDVIEENTKIKSLLFFNGNIDRIKELIRPYLTITNDEKQNKDDTNLTDTKIKTNFRVKTIKTKKAKERNGAYLHSSSRDKVKKRRGKTSEKKVFNKLTEIYTEKFVSWKSKEDEGLHYDIRYSKNQGESWTYLEVKSFNNNFFYLSSDEKMFGEKHKDNYEIWLVKENELYPISLSTLGEKSIEPTEFIVFLEIETDEE